jgi:hypothetical protein
VAMVAITMVMVEATPATMATMAMAMVIIPKLH